jgi:uncharacterized protein YyaL (SSP411 family)
MFEQNTPAAYRRHAAATMDFIQTNLWDASAHRYHPAFPRDPKSLPWDFMWGNGVTFSALVGGLRYDPAKYRPLMDAFFDGLQGYWDKDAPIPGYDAYLSSPTGDDKYYDDNAWMVLTFAEAYTLTRDRRYLDRAVETMRYVLSGWDEQLGGGIYWKQDHKSKNTCSNGPSATAALALAGHLNRGHYVDWARRIVLWTNKTLQAPDGTFWDNCALDGRVEKTRWTYNTALMLRANLGLYRVMKDKAYLEEAKRQARASEVAFVNPKTGAFKDDALFSHLLVEAFLDLYAETKEAYLLNRARANAAFVTKNLFDPKDGGYWSKWDIVPERREDRKKLIANASVARLFWLMAPYPDETGK